MNHYRSEWKYLCTDGQLELLHSRLNGILAPDHHAADSNGVYRVHSLYFDDYNNSCAAGNESGDGIRYKYRARFYNHSLSTMHLERKEKQYGLGDKKTCPLTHDEYNALLTGDCGSTFWETDKPLLKNFYAQVMMRGFAPKAVIDYERTAFVEPITHIRITLDRDITAAYDCDAFTQGSYVRFPLQGEHQNILEVKFDEILPGWLRHMIESLNLQQITFSKYYLGRKRLENILQ